jgi:ADP-ribose pyrophosphatase
MDVNKYKVVSSKQVWAGHIFTIRVDDVQMPAGNVAQREVLSHAGAVGVVAVTKDRQVVLVRQYRHATRSYLWEIPAGKLDRDETPTECARRELREEAGVEFEDVFELAEFHNSPGYSSELFHLYLAEVTSIGETQPDGDEELEMERSIIPLEDALAMIDKGEIIDAKTMIGLLMADRWLKGRSA